MTARDWRFGALEPLGEQLRAREVRERTQRAVRRLGLAAVALLVLAALALPASAQAHGHHHHGRRQHHHRSPAPVVIARVTAQPACPAEELPPDFDQAQWERETAEAEHETPQEERAAEERLWAYIETAPAETPAEEAADEARLDAEIAEASGC